MNLRNWLLVLVLALSSVPALWSQSISEPTLQEQYDALKQKLTLSEQNYQALLLKSNNYEATLQEVMQSSLRLTQRLLEAHSNLATSQSDLASLTQSSEALVAKLQTISAELANTKEQLAASKTELENLRVQLTDLNEKLATSEGKLEQISKQYEELLTAYQEQTQKLEALSTKYDTLLTLYNKVLDKVTELEGQLKAAVDTVIRLQKELDKANKELMMQFLKGAGVGAGVAAVVGTILYFTALPHNK